MLQGEQRRIEIEYCSFSAESAYAWTAYLLTKWARYDIEDPVSGMIFISPDAQYSLFVSLSLSVSVCPVYVSI